MRIAIVTVGTRGDVEPYLGVAAALQARGHRVVFATHAEFEPQIREAGLEIRPVRGGMRELLQTPLGRNWLASADSPLKYARYAKALFQPLFRAWLEDADAAAEGADAVVFYLMAMVALDAAERRGIPAVALAPWPSAPTREPLCAQASWVARLPAPLRRPAMDLLLRATFGAFQGEHAAYRARVGLPPSEAPTPYHRVFARRVPLVHLFSDAVVRAPRDWPAQLVTAGFAAAPPRTDYHPAPELARFLENGPSPIYVGFGSMTGHSPDALARVAAEAAARAGVRMVYATGWAAAAPAPSERVHVVAEAPHDWLFPRVSAVVHHGGAGTFAAGLRAGRPAVIVPFFADQPFWASVNARLGTGPAGIPRQRLSAARLAAAIDRVVHDGRHRAAAERVAASLAGEDGAARAAELIEQLCARGAGVASLREAGA